MAKILKEAVTLTRNFILLLLSVLIVLTVPASAVASECDGIPSEPLAYQLELKILSPEGKPVTAAQVTVLEKDSGRVVSQFNLHETKILDLTQERAEILTQGRERAVQQQIEYTGITDINYIAFITTSDAFGVYNFPMFYVNEKDYSLYRNKDLAEVGQEIEKITASSTKEICLQLSKITAEHLKVKNSYFVPDFVDIYVPRKYAEEWIGSYCVWIDEVYNLRSGRVGVEYYYETGRKQKIEVGTNISGKWASGGGFVSITNKRTNASKWGKSGNRIGSSAGFCAGSNFSFFHEYWMIPRPVGVPVYYEQVTARSYDGGTHRLFYNYVSNMEKPYQEVKNNKHGRWSVLQKGDLATFNAESGLEIGCAVKIYNTFLSSVTVFHSKSCHYYSPEGDGSSSWRVYFYDRFTNWKEIFLTEGRL